MHWEDTLRAAASRPGAPSSLRSACLPCPNTAHAAPDPDRVHHRCQLQRRERMHRGQLRRWPMRQCAAGHHLHRPGPVPHPWRLRPGHRHMHKPYRAGWRRVRRRQPRHYHRHLPGWHLLRILVASHLPAEVGYACAAWKFSIEGMSTFVLEPQGGAFSPHFHLGTSFDFLPWPLLPPPGAAGGAPSQRKPRLRLELSALLPLNTVQQQLLFGNPL